MLQAEIIAEERPAIEKSGHTESGRWEFRGDEFVGKIEPRGGRYAFSVRDLRRERPTIHGFENDYSDAVFAVKQVIQALEHHA